MNKKKFRYWRDVILSLIWGSAVAFGYKGPFLEAIALSALGGVIISLVFGIFDALNDWENGPKE